jgi:hypothetical protein
MHSVNRMDFLYVKNKGIGASGVAQAVRVLRESQAETRDTEAV